MQKYKGAERNRWPNRLEVLNGGIHDSFQEGQGQRLTPISSDPKKPDRIIKKTESYPLISGNDRPQKGPSSDLV